MPGEINAAEWGQLLIDALREIDRQETPHGLYGLRESRRTPTSRPPLPAILVGAPLLLQNRISQRAEKPWFGRESFEIYPPESLTPVTIAVLDFADTKVRKFGDTYRLDDKTIFNGRERPDFEKLLPKMARYHRRATLFLGHFHDRKDAETCLGKAAVPSFLQRYQLRHAFSLWQDVHDRAFHSLISLWWTGR